jgi:hypothetical protein
MHCGVPTVVISEKCDHRLPPLGWANFYRAYGAWLE